MPNETQPTSILGIISTVIGILTGTGVFTIFIIAGYLETNSTGVIEDSFINLGAGLAALTAVFIHLTGAVIGIVGIFQKDKNKLFAIAGTILNVLILLSITMLILTGLLME